MPRVSNRSFKYNPPFAISTPTWDVIPMVPGMTRCRALGHGPGWKDASWKGGETGIALYVGLGPTEIYYRGVSEGL